MKLHVAIAAVLSMVLATTVMAWQASPSESFTGEIATVDAPGMSLTVKQEAEANTMTFKIDAETKIQRTAPEEGDLNFSDLKAGDRVTVDYVLQDGDYVARTISVEAQPTT